MAGRRRPAARASRGQLRIIGGSWRGRKLPIPDADGLRPTPDRVRETLFNWLGPDVVGARVLDAYAGTGALGLEALSRGAERADLVEAQPAVAEQLRVNVATLQASASIIGEPALVYLGRAAGPYDLVFLDPPFEQQLWGATLTALPPLLARGAKVYVEYPRTPEPQWPAGWRQIKASRAGEVAFGLLQADSQQGELD